MMDSFNLIWAHEVAFQLLLWLPISFLVFGRPDFLSLGVKYTAFMLWSDMQFVCKVVRKWHCLIGRIASDALPGIAIVHRVIVLAPIFSDQLYSAAFLHWCRPILYVFPSFRFYKLSINDPDYTTPVLKLIGKTCY